MPRARPPGQLPARLITPEGTYWNRRAVLRALGFSGAAILLGSASGCGETSGGDSGETAGSATSRDAVVPAVPVLPPARPETFPRLHPFPAPPNARFTVPDRPLTREDVAGQFNNFYEFSEDKEDVCRHVDRFRMHPWTLEVAGLVGKPRRFDLDDILALPQEERVYRFRCVEAWSMVVPWTGLPLARLIDLCAPLPAARYVRFTSFHNALEAPNQRNTRYAWPYYEALRLDEARHELTLLVTGIYGQPLKKQHGGPLRLIVPWKYGYKSAKSIVRIELTEDQPHTFWNDLQPLEYSFVSNVDPAKPHPRWSQGSERVIGTGARIPTLPYNGYGDLVAGLYRT